MALLNSLLSIFALGRLVSATAINPSNVEQGVRGDTSPNDVTSACPTAHISQGSYRGIDLNGDVSAFLGVPYAQPPVGDLRFRPPLPLTATTDANASLIDASKFGSVCYQFHYRSVMQDNILETTPESEDCLTLNIFIPRKGEQSKGLPVLFWIYGGSFSEGAGSMPGMLPDSMTQWSALMTFHSL